MSRWLSLAAGGVLVLSLAACSQQFSWPDQPNAGAADSVVLAAGSTIGQTFVALEAGLAGVDVYLAPQGALQGEVRLVLQAPPETPGVGVDVATASRQAADLTQPAFYHFSFSPQPGSRLHSYYIRLAYAGPGQILVGHGGRDVYQQGALYRNDGPDDSAQLAFRLSYDAAAVAADVGRQVLTWFGWLALAALLFVIPGWALLAWLWPDAGQMAWGEQLGLAVGLSVAVYPILFLWTSLVGLHLGWWYAALPVALGLVALAVWAVRVWRRTRPRLGPVDWGSPHLAPDLALFGVLALVFAVRFWTVRGLAAPMWGDSYQHSVIAQLIVDHGGLFTDWAPYADLQTFTYHFGFHTLVAVFHWLSGLSIPDAVLWAGQILNGLAAVALYPLAMRVSGQRWAGVGAVLIAGLLSPTPMVYTNWGRYTQLAGQIVLPVAIALAWPVLDNSALPRRAVALAVIALGGLALSHYRVLIFAVIFFVAYAMLNLRAFGRSWRRFAALAAGSGLFFLPWFIRVFGGRVFTIFSAQIANVPVSTSALADNNTFGDVSLYPTWLLLLGAVCLGLGLWRRDRGVALVGLWGFLVLLAANPQWLHLPGQGALTNFAAFVLAYLPLGLLAGSVLASIMSQWPRLGPAVLTLVMAAGLWGGWQRARDIRPDQYALVTWPDLRAAEWLRANSPPSARVLVNSFFAYSGTLQVGSDGGWWLPLLAQRATMLPPINYAFEQGNRPDYIQWINEMPRAISERGIGGAGVAQLLADRAITYVYLGQLRGQVNNSSPPVLDAGALLSTPGLQLVYHQDRVFIFKIVR